MILITSKALFITVLAFVSWAALLHRLTDGLGPGHPLMLYLVPAPFGLICDYRFTAKVTIAVS